MKKYLIYTDPHFCQYSSILRKRGERYSVRLHNLINSISWAEHLADDEGCDSVLCLGDFFDRPEINAEEVTALQEVYFSKLPHIMLTGNHDSNIASLEYSSIKVFKSMQADIITQPKCIEVNGVELYFIPYIADHKLLSLKDYIHDNNKKKVILSHNDLAGIQYGKFTSESGFDVNDILDNCTLFLNGHLHNGYVIHDKIILIGDLTGQNFNEDAYKFDHYAYIMTIDDDGTITLDPRVNPHAFNFYKVYINSISDIERLKRLKDNAVVSIICDSEILKEVDSAVNEIDNIIEYKLIANYAQKGDDSTFDFTVEDHLKQFIEYVQTKLEPSQILSEELSLLGGYNDTQVH